MVNPEHEEPSASARNRASISPALGLPWDRRAVVTAVLTALVVLAVVVGAVWTARSASPSSADVPSAMASAPTTSGEAGTEPTVPAPADCGTPVATLETLAAPVSSPTTNPTSLMLAASPYEPSYGYQPYPMGLTLTNTGTATFAGWAETAMLLVTDGEKVVGMASLDGSPTSLNRIDPGLSVDYPDPPQATRCPGVDDPAWGGEGLPAGDYSLWVVIPVHETSPDHTAGQVVAGPVPWTVTDPAAATPYACGAPVDRLQGFAQSASSPFAVSATLPTAPVGTFHLATAHVTNRSGVALNARSIEIRLAYVQNQTVVGGAVLASDGTAQTVGDAPITYGEEVSPASCTTPSTDPIQDDGPTLPAGQYDVWTFTSVLLDPTHADDPSSAYVADGPWPVTLTGTDTSDAVRDATDAVFVCRQPVATSEATSGAGLTLDLQRTNGPWVARDASDTSPDGTLRSSDGKVHDVATAQAPSIALTDAAGDVTWLVTGRYQDLDLRFISFTSIGPGEPDNLVASDWVLWRCPSTPGWPADIQPAGTTLPAGSYTAWPYLVVDEGQGPRVLLGSPYPMSVG